MTWPVDVELAEAQAELARARRALLMSERADMQGRVANRALWLASLGRQRERQAELERVIDALAEEQGYCPRCWCVTPESRCVCWDDEAA